MYCYAFNKSSPSLDSQVSAKVEVSRPGATGIKELLEFLKLIGDRKAMMHMAMQSYSAKILIAGPVGAGKSTFVRTLSETPFVDTDVTASEEIGKLATTVGIDFGTRTVDDLRLLLFGVPGQNRFDFMWEVTCEGAQGFVMLVAADRPASFIEAKRTLRFLRDRMEVPVVVGITRTDLGEDWDTREVSAYLNVPVECILNIDPRSEESCMTALGRLFEYITPRSNLLTVEESFSLV